MPKKKVYQADVVTYDLCLNNLHEDFDKKKKLPRWYRPFVSTWTIRSK